MSEFVNYNLILLLPMLILSITIKTGCYLILITMKNYSF